MGRIPCCEKTGLKKGKWTAEEDEKLINYIKLNGDQGSWRSLPKNAGLLRCGKSCRLRWINYLRADVKRGNFTEKEEETIVKLHNTLGNRWSLIASHLPGRTDNEIKNYWNSHLSRTIYRFRRSMGETTGPPDPYTSKERDSRPNAMKYGNYSNVLTADVQAIDQESGPKRIMSESDMTQVERNVISNEGTSVSAGDSQLPLCAVTCPDAFMWEPIDTRERELMIGPLGGVDVDLFMQLEKFQEGPELTGLCNDAQINDNDCMNMEEWSRYECTSPANTYLYTDDFLRGDDNIYTSQELMNLWSEEEDDILIWP